MAVVFSLFSNPITIPPLFFFAYQLGAMLLGLEEKHVEFSVLMGMDKHDSYTYMGAIGTRLFLYWEQ